MATPSASSIVNFVKKYPITLCGFSLLFMPSVHRLLLYFTPLLLSTAIFIVAMLTWGPSAMSSDQRGKRRGRRNDWAFNGSLKIYEEEEEGEEEEEEEEEIAEVTSQRKINDGILQEKDISIKGKESKKFEVELQEPDPDFDEESNGMGTTSAGAIVRGQADEPDPDLDGDGVGTASNGAISGAQAEPRTALGGDCLGEPDPDLHRDGVDSQAEPDLAGDCVGRASYEAPAAGGAEPDPDLHGEHHVEDAHDQDFSAEKHLHDQQAADSDHVDDYHDAEPDPDLHGEGAAGAVHAAQDVEIKNDDLHEQIFAELRQNLGVIKRTPYTDDIARDHMHSQKLAERLQTLQAAA